MEPHEDVLKKDLEATVRTRQELGREYESELIDSFLGRLDARLDAQIERRVSEELARQEDIAPVRRRRRERERRDPDTWFSMFSLIMAIPLSGIAAGTGRLTGLAIVWLGIVGVNWVRYRSRRIEREERRSGTAHRSEWA